MNKNKKSKPLVSGLIAFAVIAGLWMLIFGINFGDVLKLVLGAALALVAGFVVYQMAKGVDTSKKAPSQKKFESTGNPEVDDLIRKGEDMLRQIREEDRRIPDERVSAKIVSIGEKTEKIFQAVAEQPDKAPRIRRFMNYYLPTTLKLLTAYQKIGEREHVSAEATDAAKQIEGVLETVDTAFGKQLDAVYRDDMLDITTDIEVLETVLKQDGLTDSGLHGNRSNGSNI